MDDSRQIGQSTAAVDSSTAVGSYYQPIGAGDSVTAEPVVPPTRSEPYQSATVAPLVVEPKVETAKPALAPVVPPITAPVIAPSTQIQSGDVSTKMQAANQTHQSKGNTWLWLVLGGVALLALAVVAFFFFGKKQPAQPIGEENAIGSGVQPNISDNKSVVAGKVCSVVGGQVFLYNVDEQEIDFVSLSAGQKEYSSRVSPGTYKVFLKTPGGSYLGFTDANHNLDSVVVSADGNSTGIDLCDDVVNVQSDAKMLALAKTAVPATVHGLVCGYGQDVFPAGTVLFYESEKKDTVTYEIPANDNTFSVQVPPGEYAVFFLPADTSLPKYGYTEYVTCGLNPTTCLNHDLLVNKLESGQEYGNVKICDPQYVQTDLPKELIYENK